MGQIVIQDRQAPFWDGKSVKGSAVGAQLAPFRALFAQVEKTSMKNTGKIDKGDPKNGGAFWRFLALFTRASSRNAKPRHKFWLTQKKIGTLPLGVDDGAKIAEHESVSIGSKADT
jgi:hypothetical protein